MNFEFATAQRILFGPDKIRELPAMIDGIGTRAALVCGNDTSRCTPILAMLEDKRLKPVLLSISSEPTTADVAALVAKAKKDGCDFVVAFGGGSVIDAGKAVAALLTNPKNIINYLEVIGLGEPLTEEPAPFIAIPTTAGTGAEVTRNSVLQSTEHKVKVSMRHPKMLPTVAIVDPVLTLTVPPEVTASTGLDAFTQLLEPFVSAKANPLTDALCQEGLKLVSRSLLQAFTTGGDLAARTDMALGSLFGGLALANSGLGAVHGFAGPIGGMFNAPHGMVCASLLPAVFEANIEAMQDRDPKNTALEKYNEVGRIITGNPRADSNDALLWIKDLSMQMMVPGLDEFNIAASDFPALVAKAKNSSSMKGNPIELSDEELTAILAESLIPPINGNSTIYM